MAQGGLKKKSVNFSTTSKKSSKHSKPLGPRKGAHYIAPKKSKKTKAADLKKQLQKQIGKRIEQDLTQRAGQAGTEFRILSNPAHKQSTSGSNPTHKQSTSCSNPAHKQSASVRKGKKNK